MKALANYAICPQCSGGHKSRPYCEYENGAYCFSCGYTKVSDRSFTPSREIQTDNPYYPELEDCINNYSQFSLPILQWLTKHHVSEKHVQKYDIMQHKDGSIIYPNIQREGAEKTIIGYQRRWLGGERKIITKGLKSPSFYNTNKERTIAIVEDFLSAIRVAGGVNSCCLWGTKLPFRLASQLVCDYDKIYVWLDNDTIKEVNSGQEAAIKICKLLEDVIHYKNKRRFSHNQKVINIVTEQDPKFYVDSGIKEILKC